MSFIVNLNGKPQIYVHGYDLGTYGRTYALGFEQDAIDVTAFADVARRRIIGNQTVTLTGDTGTTALSAQTIATLQGRKIRFLKTAAATYSVWAD